MVLEYTVTKKDYENVIYSDLRKKTSKGRLGCFLPVAGVTIATSVIFVIILMLMVDDRVNLVALLPLLFPVLLIALGMLVTNKRVIAKLVLRERIKSGGMDKEYFGSHTLEILDDRLLLRYGNTVGERLYGGIDHIAEYTGAVAIFLSSVSCDIIPNSAFRSIEERRSFVSLIQSRMAIAKDVPISGETVDESRSEARFTVDYSWDEQSLADALIAGNRLVFKTRLAWTPGRIITTLIGLVFLYGGIRSIAQTAHSMANGSDFAGFSVATTVLLLLFGVLLLINLFMVFTPWIRSIVIRQIRNGAVQRDMVGNHTICVYHDKVKVFSRLSSQDIGMEQIYCVRRIGGVLHLVLKAKVLVPVPVSAFRSEDMMSEVAAYIDSRIGRK